MVPHSRAVTQTLAAAKHIYSSSAASMRHPLLEYGCSKHSLGFRSCESAWASILDGTRILANVGSLRSIHFNWKFDVGRGRGGAHSSVAWVVCSEFELVPVLGAWTCRQNGGPSALAARRRTVALDLALAALVLAGLLGALLAGPPAQRVLAGLLCKRACPCAPVAACR